MGMKLVVVVVVDICRVDASNWGYGRISCVCERKRLYVVLWWCIGSIGGMVVVIVRM